MRALLLDDEQLVLDGLGALLEARVPDLTLDCTPSVEAALRLVSTLSYQLVLADWHLTGGSGEPVTALRVIRALQTPLDGTSPVPVVVISGDDRLDAGRLTAELGLAGFVPKSASCEDLLEAISVARRGGVYRSGAAAVRMFATPPRLAQPSLGAEARLKYPELTDRQADVLEHMARGASDKEIGRALGIAESTVKTHVRAILDVVGVRRRGEAVFRLQQNDGGSGGKR